MRAAVSRILFPARNAETLVWRATVVADGGYASNQNLLIVDKTISRAKALGIWTKLDRLWLFDAENSQGSLRDIVTTALATATNSPTFTVSRGYTGNGTTSHINTNFDPSAGGAQKISQNSGCIFAWNRTTTAAAGLPLAGKDSGNFRTYIYPYNTATDYALKINSAGANIAGTTPGDGSGLWAINRSGAAAMEGYQNGAQLGTNAAASEVHQAINLTVLKDVSGFGTYQCAAYGIGSSLSATDHANLFRAVLLPAMQAVGAA